MEILLFLQSQIAIITIDLFPYVSLQKGTFMEKTKEMNIVTNRTTRIAAQSLFLKTLSSVRNF